MTVKYPRSQFDTNEVHDLLTAYNGACAQLELAADDKAGRDELADLVMQLVRQQRWDASELQIEAVRLFRQPRYAT